MKKILVLLSMISICYAYENIPIIPQDVTEDTNYSANQEIEFKNIKRKKMFQEGQTKAQKGLRPKIKLDENEILNQRALDYTTGDNNRILPGF